MTALFRIGRTSSKGCMKSRICVVASRWMRYSKSTKGRPASAASWALRIFDAATICMALVICDVLPTDLIRRLKSRALFISRSL
jgi:hypothetical protein